MGESVTEGAIVEWRKAVGDFVAEGDPLVEVTTDKVDVEVPATVSGVVTQIAAKEGDTVAVGSLLAKIDTSKTNGAAKKTAAKKNGAAGAEQPAAAAPAPVLPTPASGEAVADVAAQRTAQRLDVDLKLVRGSGPMV
jgi:pyruvate/2-oxoglutarate dehydrogenase complex dihydrolipoamide acyltransferase (E2) component